MIFGASKARGGLISTNISVRSEQSIVVKRFDCVPMQPVSWGNGDTKGISLFELETDRGETALGCGYASAACIQEGIKHLLPFVDNRVLDPAAINRSIREALGRSIEEEPKLAAALSALDIALWDLLGKRLNKPIKELIGGGKRSKIKAYASLELAMPASLPDKAIEAKIQDMLGKGFKALKIYIPRFGYGEGYAPGRPWRQYEKEIISYVRKVAGTGITLMWDAYGSAPDWPNGYDWAYDIGMHLRDEGFLWFEEPLSPKSLTDYQSLTGEKIISISGCESFHTYPPFEKWADAEAVNILQPDLTVVGGISVAKEIAEIVPQRCIILHGWSSAVGLAADLQFMSTMPLNEMCLIEYMPTPHITEPLVTNWQLDEEGMLSVPDDSGLGVAIDREKIKNKQGVFDYA